MSFAEQLAELLPGDLPHRETLIAKGSRHLEMIVETNRQFNLTRILDQREAAIKHVVDSVIPWRWFAGASEVVDAGTGAGFPGIPLAIVLPEVRFILVESITKKARFVSAAAAELDLENTAILHRRVEEVLRTRGDVVITARAFAPLARALDLIGPAIRSGRRALLYKGPDAEGDIAKAADQLRKFVAHARVVDRYTLPGGAGTRTLVEVARR